MKHLYLNKINALLIDVMAFIGNNEVSEQTITKFIESNEQLARKISETCQITLDEWVKSILSIQQNSAWAKAVSVVCGKPFESIASRSQSWQFYPAISLVSLNGSKLNSQSITFSKEPIDQKVQAFLYECNQVRANDAAILCRKILALCKKYLSELPVLHLELNHISAYDFARLTASVFEIFRHPGEDKLSLIAGDISGIQSFIYDIISRYASKNLKGRSHYLHVLQDSVMRQLIDKLQLDESHVLYASGGRFVLIAPSADQIKEEVEAIQYQVQKALFDRHETDLQCLIACCEFHVDDFQSEKLAAVFAKIIQEIANQKAKPFHRLLEKHPELFFTPSGKGGKAKRDQITGREIKHNAIKLDNELVVSATTQNLIEAGQKLKDATYFFVTKDHQNQLQNKHFYLEVIPGGYRHYMINEVQQATQIAPSGYLVALNRNAESDFSQSIICDSEYYGGNDFPIDRWGQPKVFEEFCGAEFLDREKQQRKPDTEVAKLGVLRMDVDFLGNIFSKGIPQQYYCLATLAQLSRSLDTYFKGHINEIWSESKKEKPFGYKDATQIIYAGGDDLFIAGRWDLMIHMAEEIRENFRNYTHQNSSLSISGGVTIVNAKFPLLKAAEFSANAEDQAKNHAYDTQHKNAITLFGIPLNWDAEFKYVKNLKNEINDLIDREALAEGFTYRIISLKEQAEIKDHQIQNLEVIWLSAYQFGRMSKAEKNEELKAFLKNWKENIFTGKIPELPHTTYHSLELLALACAWCDFERR